jgi:hypothetical protein
MEVNIKLINETTPIEIGNTSGKPFVAIGADQTWNKKSKAKYLGLWIENKQTAQLLVNVFKDAVEYFEHHDVNKNNSPRI